MVKEKETSDDCPQDIENQMSAHTSSGNQRSIASSVKSKQHEFEESGGGVGVE